MSYGCCVTNVGSDTDAYGDVPSLLRHSVYYLNGHTDDAPILEIQRCFPSCGCIDPNCVSGPSRNQKDKWNENGKDKERNEMRGQWFHDIKAFGKQVKRNRRQRE